MERKSGILLHISSLPSPYGIGTLGREAHSFVDFLAAAGQRCWQLLPLGPTGLFDSPYQSFSTYAGNPYFVDLDLLRAEGLLERSDYEGLDFGRDPRRVDYGKLYAQRIPVLRRAYARFRMREGWRGELDALFARERWLSDYALFMALKAHFGGVEWPAWPDAEIRMRRPGAMARYRALLDEEIGFHAFVQGRFFAQWETLRAHVRARDIQLIGDLPIYVPLDSADVWAAPALFQLDGAQRPTAVAGVPPDSFSADGQLWGNPLYDWDAMKADGYTWWIRRIAGASRLYDILRIDHFRGLESYWAVPYGETTAKVGRWVKGPGMDLMNVLTEKFPNIQFIAEDLGYLTPEVRQLLEDSGLPGMKVLQFAFDSREAANYLPHTYPRHCVCYAGTHDNSTLMGWKDEAAPADIAMAREYLGLHDEEGFNWGVLRGGQSSVADLFIAQMQDYLGLGSEARMNTPGILGGNWQWRMLPGQITDELTARIARMTSLYGRS